VWAKVGRATCRRMSAWEILKRAEQGTPLLQATQEFVAFHAGERAALRPRTFSLRHELLRPRLVQRVFRNDQMNLRALQTFVVIVEAGGLRRAPIGMSLARWLHILVLNSNNLPE
jgi:hypothetical protein